MPNIPTRNNNPGDIKDPKTGAFRTFSNPEEGFKALESDIQGKMTGNTSTGLKPTSTIREFASTWAPASDNNDPEGYAMKLAKQLNVHPDTPIGSLQGRVHEFANAIANNEGFKGGMASADTIPQSHLSHQQMIENINAMELQGAKPNEIQAYLDSLGGGKDAPPQIDQSQPGLGAQLADRITQVSQSLVDAQTGKIHWMSGGLQAAGGLAGGVGDVVNAGLETVLPPLKPVEEMLGQAIGGLLDTPDGKALVASTQAFSQAHPEISGDLGAAVNVLSVLPIFKGLSLAKGAVMDATGSILKTRLEGAVTKEVSEAIGKSGRNIVDSASARGLDPLKTIATGEGGAFLPEVKMTTDGRAVYDTAEAHSVAQQSISQDEELLQEVLENASRKIGAVQGTVSLERLRADALEMAKKEFSDSGRVGTSQNTINKVFDDYISSKGASVDLPELNKMKRALRDAVNFNSQKIEQDVNYQLGQLFMDVIEKRAMTEGRDIVGPINKRMASKIEAMKVLKALDGKIIKSGFGSKVFKAIEKGVGMIGGEVGGKALGIPFAGALTGYGLSGLLPNTNGLALNMLRRGTQGSLGTAASGLLQAGGKVGKGLGVQGIQGQLQEARKK